MTSTENIFRIANDETGATAEVVYNRQNGTYTVIVSAPATAPTSIGVTTRRESAVAKAERWMKAH